MKRGAILAATACAVWCLQSEVSANEGQWTPDQIAELDAELLKKMGLELSAAQLWNPKGDERNGGLMRAAVNLSGCSAAFVSKDGLIATNHHCAYGALQSNSTVEHDYLADGFVAKTRVEELRAKGRTIRVLRSQREVTEQVHAATKSAKTDAARAQSISKARKKLVDACESKGVGLSCQVASFYNGSSYRIFEYVELRDVRLVYAPPAAVGEYGGETDNWMWPRHTGDFALMRAYANADQKPAEHASTNVPYQPGQFLKVSTQGVHAGDFVGILGYPGRTQRYLSAPDIQRNIDQILPGIVDVYGEWISILEAHSQRDPAVSIKVAALKKSLANRHKNARGMLDGLGHMKLLEARVAEEEKLSAWAAEEGREAYRGVLAELKQLSEQARLHHERDTLVSMARRGPATLGLAIDLVRRARARGVADLERPAGFRERDEKRLWSRQETRLRDYDVEVDVELLSSLLARTAKLDEGLSADARTLAELSKIASSKGGTPLQRSTYAGRARQVINGSKLHERETFEALWADATPASLAKSKDPAIMIALGLADTIEESALQRDSRSGALSRLRPKYFEMLRANREGPIYPDANGTLRFSFASVRGYNKWDGSTQVPLTSLGEAVEKHTGAPPFNLPAKVRQNAKSAKHTYWAEPELGDVPLCFLSDGDTTGGNSGSPVINGKGELVGFNFDRVWENIAGDFAYFEGHSRNVSADVRHLLWMLDEVDDAGHLLDELGVGQFRDAPARANPSAAAPPIPDLPSETPSKAAAPTVAPAQPSSGGCVCAAGGDRQGGGWLAFALLGLPLSRRRRFRGQA